MTSENINTATAFWFDRPRKTSIATLDRQAALLPPHDQLSPDLLIRFVHTFAYYEKNPAYNASQTYVTPKNEPTEVQSLWKVYAKPWMHSITTHLPNLSVHQQADIFQALATIKSMPSKSFQEIYWKNFKETLPNHDSLSLHKTLAGLASLSVDIPENDLPLLINRVDDMQCRPTQLASMYESLAIISTTHAMPASATAVIHSLTEKLLCYENAPMSYRSIRRAHSRFYPGQFNPFSAPRSHAVKKDRPKDFLSLLKSFNLSLAPERENIGNLEILVNKLTAPNLAHIALVYDRVEDFVVNPVENLMRLGGNARLETALIGQHKPETALVHLNAQTVAGLMKYKTTLGENGLIKLFEKLGPGAYKFAVAQGKLSLARIKTQPLPAPTTPDTAPLLHAKKQQTAPGF